MLTPVLLLVLLPLVHSEGVNVEFETSVPEKTDFHYNINPGFKISTASKKKLTFNGADLAVCQATPAAPCYVQKTTSKVTFAVADKSATPKVQFKDDSGNSATFKIASLGETDSLTGVTNAATAYSKTLTLYFKPTQMIPLDKTDASGTAVDSEKSPCPATTDAVADCFKTVDGDEYLDLMAKVESEAALLKLTNGEASGAAINLTATFTPRKAETNDNDPTKTTSAAAGMAGSYAAIVVYLVLMFLLH